MSLAENVPYLRWRTTQLAQFELTYALKDIGKVNAVFVVESARTRHLLIPSSQMYEVFRSDIVFYTSCEEEGLVVFEQPLLIPLSDTVGAAQYAIQQEQMKYVTDKGR